MLALHQYLVLSHPLVVVAVVALSYLEMPVVLVVVVVPLTLL
jgi:hypothetical protein